MREKNLKRPRTLVFFQSFRQQQLYQNVNAEDNTLLPSNDEQKV